jgi:TPR repeat protein
VVIGVVVAVLGGCPGPLESTLPAEASRTLREEARACDEGDSISCSNVAQAYEVGDGVPVDVARAEAMYRVACDGGAWLACINLAAMLESKGLSDVASALLSKACEGGEALGCYRQGQLVVAQARPGDVDAEARALELFGRACAGLIRGACVEVGRFVRDGRGGVPADAHAAAVMFAQACEGGEPSACGEYGAALLSGEGFPRDVELGLATLERACISEQGAACATLWESYSRGLNGATVDAELGARFGRMACEYGVAAACAGPAEGSN